jgi:hypothetical protein
MLPGRMSGTPLAGRERPATGLRGVGRPSGPAIAVACAVLAFLAVTAWWLTQDARVPDADSAGHMDTALQYLHGGTFDWFTRFDIYPPLVRLLGAGAAWIGGVHVASFVAVDNLVFVPLLALGCYGAGTLAADRRAGALAALFALGTPMLVSLFHVFLLDAPLTAFVALSVWLLLACRRFESVRVALAAGLAVGLGMMIKSTFPAYVAGVVLVMLVRGGWRRPVGIAAFLAPIAVVAGPWYLAHAFDQAVFANGVAVTGAASYNAPPRFSANDLAYYVWVALDLQYHVPGCLLAIAGTVAAGARWLRTRARDDVAPELIAGLLLGWFVTDALAQDDPRYTLPLLVFVAVLSTAWIVRLRAPALRRAAIGAVVALSVFNAFQAASGRGPVWDASVPGGGGGQAAYAGHVTFFSPAGYLVYGPKRGGDPASVLAAARRAGARRFVVEAAPTGDSDVYNGAGVTFAAHRLAGMRPVGAGEAGTLGAGDVLIIHRPVVAGAAPCAPLGDGTGLYLVRGSDVAGPPSFHDTIWCPVRPPVVARSGALAAPSPSEPAAEVALRSRIAGLLRTLRTHGIRVVAIHSSVTGQPAVRGAVGARLLATGAGLAVLPVRSLDRLGHDGAFLFVRPARRAFPAPCLRLPGGLGVYVERGHDLQPLEHAANVLCGRRA